MLPSIELATEDHSGLIGACDRDYGCIYMNTLSWRTPTTPLPMEINPRKVFERMFGQGGSAAERLARTRQDRSILDAITGQAADLQRQLGANDRATVGQYLENVREIERRVQMSEQRRRPCRSGAAGRAGGHPVLVRRARQAHVRPAGARVPGEHHAGLHVHGGARGEQPDVSAGGRARRPSCHLASPEPGREDREERQDPGHTTPGCSRSFLEKLRSTPDGDGSLLDHSIILYGSNMSNSNAHDHFPLPNLVVGRASGRLKGGRHLKYPDHTPMTNLLVTLLDKTGVRHRHARRQHRIAGEFVMRHADPTRIRAGVRLSGGHVNPARAGIQRQFAWVALAP